MALRTLGNSQESEHEPAIMAEINITPLTDVFLVLLIVFMVTSSVMSQLGVDVHLPQASNATAQAQPEGVIVTLLAGGGVKINRDSIEAGQLQELEPRLKAVFEKTASRLVILEGDREALLGSAIQVMDYARKAGAEKFAIATAPEKGG